MSTETTTKLRFLSGIQPTGSPHIGNYFGAIRQHIRNQDEGEGFFFIANYHALTTVREAAKEEHVAPAELIRSRTVDVALTYLSLGLDPNKATLFRQSDVPEVTELTWLLACVTGKGLLDRAHGYKDKVAKGMAAGLGLYLYPVLMAADILAYDSHFVPVGEDQAQHVEMTRDMARSFNDVFGECFIIPQVKHNETAKVLGTDGQKMSKSYGNDIPIFLEGKPLKKRVMSIVTDSASVEDAKDPATCNAFAMYELFATDAEREAMAERYRTGGMGYGEVKKALLEKIETFFAAGRDRRRELEANPDEVEDVLREGGKRARETAREVLDRARSLTGLA